MKTEDIEKKFKKKSREYYLKHPREYSKLCKQMAKYGREKQDIKNKRK